MLNIKKFKTTQIFCGFVTVLWIFALLFPVIWMISSSLKSNVEVYETPPKLIPSLKREINVNIDYSDLTGNNSKMKEMIKFDIVNIVWGISIKYKNENIGAVRITATKGSETIAESYIPSYKMKIAQSGRLYATSVEPAFFEPVMDQLFNYTLTRYYLENSTEAKPGERLISGKTSNSIYTFFSHYNLKGKLISVGERGSFLRMFDSYIIAWKVAAAESIGENIGFERFFLNSIYVEFMGLLGALVISSLAAYSLSKLLKPKYARFILVIFLATMMVPFMLTLIPTYELFNKFKLFDKYIALYIGAWFSPVCIYFFKGFFDGLPKELFDSAKIDGANNFIVFARIVLPLAGPVFGAMTIMQFIPLWNNFFWPFLVTQSQEKYTLPVALYRIQKHFLSTPNDIMALSLISSLPTVVIFAVFQKAIQKGIVFTGIKG